MIHERRYERVPGSVNPQEYCCIMESSTEPSTVAEPDSGINAIQSRIGIELTDAYLYYLGDSILNDCKITQEEISENKEALDLQNSFIEVTSRNLGVDPSSIVINDILVNNKPCNNGNGTCQNGTCISSPPAPTPPAPTPPAQIQTPNIYTDRNGNRWQSKSQCLSSCVAAGIDDIDEYECEFVCY